MPSPARFLLALVAILALTMAACSGGSDGETTTADTDSPANDSGVYEVEPGDSSADVVADPGDNDEPVAVLRNPGDGEALPPASALALSAERALEPETFRGTFEISMDFLGMEITMEGDYAFRAPDSMYMTMSILGESVEALILLPDMYVRVPGEGWYHSSIDDLGVDWEGLSQYAEQRGPIDYRALAEEIYGVEQLPAETIDGVTYLHYGGTLDLDALYDDVPAGLIDPTLLEETGDFVGDMSVEIWLYPDTYLPYRFDIVMEFGDLPEMPAGGGGSMTMSMVSYDYNEPVDIPEPPTDALPLDLMGY